MSDDLTKPESVRVLVVDDHEVIRNQVAARVVSHQSLVLVGTARNVNEAIASARESLPDVVVMDGALFERAPTSLCQRLHEVNVHIRCIVYTATHIDEENALNAGAAAIVLKQLRDDTLLEVLASTMHRLD